MNVEVEAYPETGLYLVFRDGKRILFDQNNIDSYAERFLSNRCNVPDDVRLATDFQACPICPKRDTGEFCHALRPVLPLLEAVDRYASHDPVTAVYRAPEGLYYSARTTMQEALRYISVLSLIHYCEKGREYRRFFYGIHPLMNAKQAVSRIFLNAFWAYGGNRKTIGEFFQQFRNDFSITSNCQIKRLRLICRTDSFMNAFVKTQLIAELLIQQPEKILDECVRKFLGEQDH